MLIPEKTLLAINVAATLAIAIMTGWILLIGESIIIPVLIGILFLYILLAAERALGSLPGLNKAPRFLRGLFVFLFFFAILFIAANYVTASAQALGEAIPGYANNLNSLVTNISDRVGYDLPDDWTASLRQWIANIELYTVLQTAVASISGAGTTLVTAILYTVFISADLRKFPEKSQIAFESQKSADSLSELVGRVNNRVGSYLFTKTFINLILAVISFVIMLFLGIDFALFWAILIGLLNYIPYLGSVVGVAFPVFLAAVQTGSVGLMGISLVLLMAAQVWVGYWLEPRMLGKSVNMSAFVVLLSLAFWSALWGSTGAVLAVPLTAIVMIILFEIPSTKPLAIMMSDDGNL